MNDKDQQEQELNKLIKRLGGEKALAKSIMEKRKAADKQDDKTESKEE